MISCIPVLIIDVQCWKEPNTCGECLPGWDGPAGDANTPCQRSGIPPEGKQRSQEELKREEGKAKKAALEAESKRQAEAESKRADTKSTNQNETTSSSLNQGTTNNCPPNTTLMGSGTCQCNAGYSPNETGTGCTPTPPAADHGCPLHSSPIGPGQCSCDPGFELNEMQSGCILSVSTSK